MSKEIYSTPRREFKDFFVCRLPFIVLPVGYSTFAHKAVLDFFELAKASPAKIRLAYEQNHCIKNSNYISGW